MNLNGSSLLREGKYLVCAMRRGGPLVVRRCRDLVTGGAPRRSAPPDAHNPSYSPFSVWAAQPAPGQQNTPGAFWAGMGAGWAGRRGLGSPVLGHSPLLLRLSRTLNISNTE